MQVHPNSLANLRSWKPGDCPNPGGRPKGLVHVSEHLKRLGGHTQDQLRSMLKDPTATANLQIAARLMLQAMGQPASEKRSDQVSARAAREAAAEVMDRTTGKARQTIETVASEPPTAHALLARIRARFALPTGTPAQISVAELDPVGGADRNDSLPSTAEPPDTG